MENLLKAVLQGQDKQEFDTLIETLKKTHRQYFLRNEILQVFSQLCSALNKPLYFFHSSVLGELIQFTHEILIDNAHCWLLLRPSVAQQVVYRVNRQIWNYEPMTAADLLNRRDRVVNCEDLDTFEINLEPFFIPELTIDDPRNIGQGYKFLHQFLLDKHTKNQEEWESTLFQIIHQCRYGAQSFLIGSDIYSLRQLKSALAPAYACLEKYQDYESSDLILKDFKLLGLEPGWGNTIGRCRATLKLLERVIDCPDACNLEAFLKKIPNIFSVVSVSVHGWVAQSDVLGKPETAGQVAYVLDQARSLENQLIATIEQAGLAHLNIHPQVVILTRLIPDCEGTQCSTKFEEIHGTKFSKILRIPFRDDSGEIITPWISKFQSWQYLQQFAEEACLELMPLMQGRKPDLIIGHYSDGNLVAYRMAKRLNTLHCNIAHSLEKTKHLFGDIYWQDLESQYHFSSQFAADLISMNSADFILTSSQHEIFGNHDTIGQYESYQCFTLPNLFHVVNGINLRSSKFSVVPPGVDETIFYPYSEYEQRHDAQTRMIESFLFEQNNDFSVGHLADPSLRPLFTFAPLQTVKNLTGLLEAFGQSLELQAHCNLILLTGKNLPEQADNPEEKDIICLLHQLIEKYKLESHIRWIGHRFSSEDLGEIYRVIADRQGLLMHCVHFEAFGLTLLEGMISGLPVVTTKFGGAAEVVVDDKTGFSINPTLMEDALNQVLDFIQRCEADPLLWLSFSDASIHHIHTHYRWDNHINKLLTLTKIHKYLKQENRVQHEALHQYLEALYRLIYQQESPRTRCIRQAQSMKMQMPQVAPNVDERAIGSR